LAHLEEITLLRREIADSGSIRGNGAAGGLARLIDFLDEYREQTLDEIQGVADFARGLPAGVKLALAPKIEAGVLDLRALARVAGYVMSGVGMLTQIEAAKARTGKDSDVKPTVGFTLPR
jgi:hypothetical protein